MRIHAIQTGRVRIKASQIVGRGHGLARRLAPLIDREWSDWLPTFAYAIEHRDGVILVDTGASAGLDAPAALASLFPACGAVRRSNRKRRRGRSFARSASAPADVKRVVLTHMHIDHDGGPRRLSGERDPGQSRASSRSRPGSRGGCAATFRSAGRRASIRSRWSSTAPPMGPSPARAG